jgi:hypothetical protein
MPRQPARDCLIANARIRWMVPIAFQRLTRAAIPV